jgi:hypothetical protein
MKKQSDTHDRLVRAQHAHEVMTIRAELKVTESKLALLRASLDHAIANRPE